MFGLCAFIRCVVLYVGAAAAFAILEPISAQAPAATPARAEPQAISRAALLKTLELTIATKPFQDRGAMWLRDALNLLEETVKSKHGQQLLIFVDTESFKAENPDAPAVEDTQIAFPPGPQEMTVAEGLAFALLKVETKNATFVVMPKQILITTYERISPESKLQEKVRGVYQKRPLESILAELSETLGTTIIIDKRAAEKAKTEVAATFVNDIDLAGALRVLTEMADLKVVVLEGAIFVTTPTHAEALRKEHLQRMMELEKIRELKEKVPIKSAPPLDSCCTGLPLPFTYREQQIDPLWPFASPPAVQRYKYLRIWPPPDRTNLMVDPLWPHAPRVLKALVE
jgi:hypothetical protein